MNNSSSQNSELRVAKTLVKEVPNGLTYQPALAKEKATIGRLIAPAMGKFQQPTQGKPPG
jgi:hypothetical protein